MKVLALFLVTWFAAAAGSGCASTRSDARHDADVSRGAAHRHSAPNPARGITPALAGTFNSPGINKSSPLRAEKVSYQPAAADASPIAPGPLVSSPPPVPTTRPLHLRPLRPAREAVWIEGHWAYTGMQETPYEWMAGHWEIPPPGVRAWVPGGWQQDGSSFVYVRGHWR